MIFESMPEFTKELKAYSKRWKTLEADIEIAKQALTQVYSSPEVPDRGLLAQAFFDGKRASRLVRTEQYEVVKMRLDCSSPGAQGKLRLVFVLVRIEATIRFIELYAKNDKDREDAVRIRRYTRSL